MAPLLVAAAVLQSAYSRARDLSPAEESAIEAAGSAVASANFCNFHIDIPALGRFIEGKVGKVSIEAEGAARTMLIVLASEAMQEDLLGTRSMLPAEKIAFCRRQIIAYGPTGRIAPGILSTAESPR
jgi:hypothetical protein